MKKNYYEILEIPTDAHKAAIKEAYRRLALLHHPDKSTSTDENTQNKITKRFQEIQEAYHTLIDPQKKEKYDCHVRSKTKQAWKPVAGFITHPTPSLGQKYKSIHATILQNLTTAPQEKDLSTDGFNHFSSLRAKDLSEPLASDLHFEPLPFEPTSAFKLYIDYLNDPSTGSHLKGWLEHAIIEEKQSQNNRLCTGLYEGFLELVSSQIPSHASLKKIIHFVRYQNPTQIPQAVEDLAFLFQHKAFRKLFRQGFEFEWNQPIKIDIPSLFHSDLDRALEDDLDAQRPLYLHTLYDVQQGLKEKYLEMPEAEYQADAWRALAFECLDYVHIVNKNTLIAINHILQACLFLKQAIQTEEDVKKQCADEKLIILLAGFCTTMSQREKPSVDFYAHHHSIHFINTLKFIHIELPMVSICLKNHMYRLMDFFPCMAEMHSNLDLLQQEGSQLAYLRHYLMTLKKWLDHNKACEAGEEKHLTLKEVDILYHLYEAHINLWAQKPHDDLDCRFDPEEEQSLRTQLMEASLAERAASFVDISRNVHSDWNMVNRDQLGFLRPTEALPFMQGLKIYQSIEGFECNDKGQVQFVFQEWNEDAPLYKRAFSSLDFQQMLQHNIYRVSFSLDQTSPQYPYHPFQTMVYSPANLQGTEYLHTLFETDYLLKFFTTGQEVQGQYPYAMRPVQAILETLPLHLQNFIAEFKSSKHNSQIHRFWLEADTIPVLEETQGVSKRRFTFGKIRMKLKTHPMVYDKDGNLDDSKDVQEGWNIYLVDDIRAFAPVSLGKDFQFRAIIILRNSNLVYFFEEQKLSRFPCHIQLSTELQEELLIQSLSPEGLLIKGERPYQDNDHFVYQLTTTICNTLKKPTYFSSERVFAEKFTEYYEEIAEAIPAFYRLQELSRATSIINKLNIIYQTHARILSEHQQNLTHYQALFKEYEEEYLSLHQRIEREYAEQKEHTSQDLQQKRNKIGAVAHTAASKEFVAFCQSHSLNPNDTILLDVSGRRKRAQYQQEINACYQNVSDFLGADNFNRSVDAFFDGEVGSLAEGIASHMKHYTIVVLTQKLTAKFSGYASTEEIKEALNGNVRPLAKALTIHAMAQAGNISDAHLKEAITQQRLFLDQLKALGIGSEAKVPAKEGLNWIPAACHHKVGTEKVTFVYGGVRIEPTMVCKLEAFRHSYRLQMPSESAFTGNLDRMKARDFIEKVKSELNAISYSYKADTFAVESMIRDLEWKLYSKPEPVSVLTEPFSPNLGFGQFAHPNHHGFLANLLTEGIAGTAAYQKFKFDSTQNKEMKSEAQTPSNNNFEGLFSPLVLIRAAKRLEILKNVITEHCNSTSSEDARALPFAHKTLAHQSQAQLQTHFLNTFEKLRAAQALAQKKAEIDTMQAKRETKAIEPEEENVNFPKFCQLIDPPHEVFNPSGISWRGAFNPPSEVFSNGFVAPGNNNNLFIHAHSMGKGDSAFVSTSASRRVAAGFPALRFLQGKKVTFLFEIESKRQAIDVNKAIVNRYAHQQEKAFLSKIYPHEIKGAWPVIIKTNKQTGDNYRLISKQFYSNPQFNPDPYYWEGHLWNTGKYLGRGLTAYGIYEDGVSLLQAYDLSCQTGDFTNTYEEGARIIGGWSGAWVGGTAFSLFGAEICGVHPFAQITCGFAGGLYGSYVGYNYGGEVAKNALYSQLKGLLFFNNSENTDKPRKIKIYDLEPSLTGFEFF